MNITRLHAKMKAKPHWWYFVVILATIAFKNVSAKQVFRSLPKNLQVLEGSEALMQCEISNLAGSVQWVKDGFALGFAEKIPGYPRYTMIGDRNRGVFNLRIVNASLEDDSEYQCQVGPAKNSDPIRAFANLTVISPPSSIEIEASSHGVPIIKQNNKVDVKENQDLMLSCIIANSKPAAEIKWYRGNVELKSTDNRHDEVIELDNKRFTVSSNLTVKASANDDLVDYKCRAKHLAISPDHPLQSIVQVSVLKAPGEPFIEGYSKGEKLRNGQEMELVCRSYSGNPPAQLIWYKNNRQVVSIYTTSGRDSASTYRFKVQPGDNKARLRCEASNTISDRPLKKEIDLTVLFSPSQVTISGPTEARHGDVVNFQCLTAPSHPPAEIRWTIDGRQRKTNSSKTEASNEGGWTTSSNMSITIDSNKRSISLLCQGINMQLADNVMTTHTLHILYPPSTPIISGYTEGSVIPAGSTQKLLCMSSGGNPTPTLTWFKNDKKINSQTKTINSNAVQSELNIIANITDNQAIYRCEAQNSATDVPLFDKKTLNVHFLPETLKIRVEPAALTSGTEATLYCDSSSSNPPVRLNWYKDGIPLMSDGTVSHQNGLWGGKISSTQVKLNITQDMNGVKIACQGTNEALQRSINEAIELQVLFPPKFTPPPSATVVGIEDESLIINLMANGNPMNIQYTWTKEGSPLEDHDNQRIVIDGPTLNFTKLARDDSGLYTCEALNSQGSAVINISVVVEYGATIESISDNVVVNPGDEAKLACAVKGNPLNENHIRWERVDYEMNTKTKIRYENGTSFLHISNAQRDDIGHFRCIADNRVANPVSRDALLIVKFVPEIDKSPTMLRAASEKNEKGRLVCRVQAAPKPTFTWARSQKTLNNTQNSGKYFIESRQIDPLTYESVLLVDKVETNDYGLYECKADNELGSSRENIRLDVTSKPDPPLSLTVLNATHDSVSLAWTPGFDGGLKTTYQLRYREASTSAYRYVDSLPNVYRLDIEGLKPNVVYLFSIMAMNNLGNSGWLPDTTKAQTKGFEPIQTKLKDEDALPKLLVVGIALIGLGLLIANTALVAWFIIRKRIKEPTNAANSKSAAIEMYAPSSYNDTVTGETLSSVSDKSDSYSNDGSQPDLTEEVNRKQTTSSTYVVEDSNDIPPPRYQKDGRLSPYYQSNTNQMMIHPKNMPNASQMSFLPSSNFDDQLINHKTYPSKNYSPGPPLDGSYYSACDRYLSYPPMDYSVASSTLPHNMSTNLDMNHHTNTSRSNTLNRRNSNLIAMNHNIIPPPDVTHTTMMMPLLVSSGTGTLYSSKPNNVPVVGILKDPKRLQQQQNQLNNVNKDLNMQSILMPMPSLVMSDGTLSNAHQLSAAQLMNNYDATNNANVNLNLSNFNHQMGFPDGSVDGHLV
ncbi:nephrin isoform X2 [Chironomus tepperi]|uniref:nephrin isoform X2 n=1 Tax=Chironomus tepperi TaxID=113505 RepID=UPI00391F8F72